MNHVGENYLSDLLGDPHFHNQLRTYLRNANNARAALDTFLLFNGIDELLEQSLLMLTGSLVRQVIYIIAFLRILARIQSKISRLLVISL